MIPNPIRNVVFGTGDEGWATECRTSHVCVSTAGGGWLME